MTDLSVLLTEVKAALQQVTKPRPRIHSHGYSPANNCEECRWLDAQNVVQKNGVEWLGALVQAVEDQQRELAEVQEDLAENEAHHALIDAEMLKAAECIKQDGHWPANAWPSPIERIWWLAAKAEISELHARLANLDAAAQPGTITARYRALEELARPMGYRGTEAAPVEKWIYERIENAEAEVAQLRADGQRLRERFQDVANRCRNRLIWLDKQTHAVRETCRDCDTTITNVLEIAEAALAQGDAP